MDRAEAAAAAGAVTAGARAVTTTVGEVHAAVAGRVRRGLHVLGPAGTAPADLAAAHAAAVYRTVDLSMAAAGAGAAALAGSVVSKDAVGWAADHDHARPSAWLGAAFGDRLVGRSAALAGELRLQPVGSAPATGAMTGPMTGPATGPMTGPMRGTVAVLVHGLGATPGQWGATVVDALHTAGATPVTARYTTGRPVARNGQDLALALSTLVDAWPVPVERLVLIGHSMGGLVICSAIHAATTQADGATWPALVTDVVTLGTPHAGAPLERLAAAGLALAARDDVARPIAALGDYRSAGIRDLAAGRAPGRLPAHVRVTAVAGTLGTSRGAAARAPGDGIVPVASATALPGARVVVLPRTGHLRLLHHPEVAGLIGDLVDG